MDGPAKSESLAVFSGSVVSAGRYLVVGGVDASLWDVRAGAMLKNDLRYPPRFAERSVYRH